jgi:hypothetical protein
MEVLSASITETTSSFLHAGYISAYPRTVWPDAYPGGQQATPELQLDVAEALRL